MMLAPGPVWFRVYDPFPAHARARADERQSATEPVSYSRTVLSVQTVCLSAQTDTVQFSQVKAFPRARGETVGRDCDLYNLVDRAGRHNDWPYRKR